MDAIRPPQSVACLNFDSSICIEVYVPVNTKDAEEKPSKLPRLGLVTRNAVHVKNTRAAPPKTTLPRFHTRHVPDYHLTVQFLKCPLLRYSRTGTHGFLRETDGSLSIPTDVAELCQSYLVHSEDELFQIAYKLFLVLTALKKSRVSARTILIVMTEYLKSKNMSTLKRYFKELERLEYIEHVNQRYRIPMAAQMLFRSIKNLP